MDAESRNIYKTARAVAGMTQERWAEALGCSPDSVRNYESGKQIPSDEIVIAMVETSSYHVLGYQHLLQKSRVAADVLPQVAHLPLPQAVIQLLCAMQDFADDHGNLMQIAADGKISTDESAVWEQISSRLDGVIRAALQVKFAKEA